MNYVDKIIGDIEVHSVDGIRDCFRNGVSPNDLFRNELLIYELTSEYLRSPSFKDCVRAFVEYGLQFDDKVLLAVLLDDAITLNAFLKEDASLVHGRYTLRCAFTPLFEVSLLHICAEYNHIACAEVLVKHGAAINEKAGIDENGFGGQTPVFHTVNQIHDNSREMLDFLLLHGAGLEITVKGFLWGNGYPWETLIPAVNPVSYAMMGLLPQMHRNEMTITSTVSRLLKAAYGIDYSPGNVPNKYLKS